MEFAIEERPFPRIETQMAALAKTNIILPCTDAPHVASPVFGAATRSLALSWEDEARIIVLSASERLV